ncbi:hypothetical protein ALO40_100972 [Pseudomonas syringae pv. viburni]|uniref:Uncharacterized protein n=1 Tax=Pseudomonas syringae pv. viburni TaxID=251703 RepID=A0A0N8TGK1_9PSED|nr:hypothetical protein ALO40_100972 [Pseudomonas syringae pv. viburni]
MSIALRCVMTPPLPNCTDQNLRATLFLYQRPRTFRTTHDCDPGQLKKTHWLQKKISRHREGVQPRQHGIKPGVGVSGYNVASAFEHLRTDALCFMSFTDVHTHSFE